MQFLNIFSRHCEAFTFQIHIYAIFQMHFRSVKYFQVLGFYKPLRSFCFTPVSLAQCFASFPMPSTSALEVL